MIIVVTASGPVELREPDNFRAFKILVERSDLSGPALAQRLEGIAKLSDDAKTAWVSQAAVRRISPMGSSAEWLASFDKMIGSVKKFGWVDDAAGTVRAHVEIAGS